jgi:hypothetical protein
MHQLFSSSFWHAAVRANVLSLQIPLICQIVDDAEWDADLLAGRCYSCKLAELLAYKLRLKIGFLIAQLLAMCATSVPAVHEEANGYEQQQQDEGNAGQDEPADGHALA